MICEITIVILYLSFVFLYYGFPQAMANAASPAYILETRKTAPCLRLLDKWAVCTLNHFLAFINDYLFIFLHIQYTQKAFVDFLLQVLIGGGRNHRMGLFDMVMIKDNHISTAGGVTNALKAVDLYLEKNNLQLEVEVVLSFTVSHILSLFVF